jgi:hypothetical protein
MSFTKNIAFMATCIATITAGTFTHLKTAHVENIYTHTPTTRQSQIAPQKPPQNTSNSDWDTTLGAGAFITPEYKGGDEYEVMPVPFIDIKYKDIIEFNVANGLRYNAISTENIKAGIGVGADFGREEDDADRLRGLEDIDPTAEGILFAEYRAGLASAGVTFKQDLIDGDGHGGHLITLKEYNYLSQLTALKSDQYDQNSRFCLHLQEREFDCYQISKTLMVKN